MIIRVCCRLCGGGLGVGKTWARMYANRGLGAGLVRLGLGSASGIGLDFVCMVGLPGRVDASD